MFMKTRIVYLVLLLKCLLITNTSNAQYTLNSDSAFKSGSANSGRIWGYAFGDYAYKTHGDSLIRGGSNQYTGFAQTKTAFAFRRIYLGYDYNITKKFSAELLLAAEDNFNQTSATGVNTTSGDLLTNNKIAFYIKLANIRWKNIWKGSDFVLGQVNTPAFSLLTEKVWSYRSIERTIADVRRTPSFDMGATLQGKFDAKGNYGYDLMVGNGTGARPENDKFKWFYGDVFAMFMNKKLVFDLYADYERLNRVDGFHHSRNMIKSFAAYNTPALTIGLEAFVNYKHKDVVGFRGADKDTLDATSTGLSAYIHGDIIKGKLRYFVRYDTYNPDTKYDNGNYTKYIGFTPNYEPSNKENFFTAGLDFMPVKNVHFMPNIWYNKYKTNQVLANTDHDLVYRVTFFYVFGK